MREINQAGIDLIKEHEGLRLDSYQDGGGVWTIGYGSTGRDIGPELTWTQEQAEARLCSDLHRFENSVEQLVLVPMTDNQFAALVSFCYNLGAGALEHSTLLRLLNEGDIEGAADQFLRWDHDGGVKVAGLTARRNDERSLFLQN